jgi:UDP-GlcNAc3NAcA epimerase
LTLIDPIGYLKMIWLIEHCSLVMTDSGGLQKEAYFFSKPCITMRDQTEWGELVDIGANILVGADKDRITEASEQFEFLPDFSGNFYGNGDASKRVIDALISYV